MKEGKPNHSDFLETKSRVSQFLRLMDEVDIYDLKSASYWAEKLKRVTSYLDRSDRLYEELETTIAKIVERQNRFLDRLLNTVSEAKKVLEEKLAVYVKETGNNDVVRKLTDEAEKRTKLSGEYGSELVHQISQAFSLERLEQIIDQYHMIIAEVTLLYFIAHSDLLKESLTELSLDKEKTKRARERLRQAKHYLEEAFEIIPPSYLQLGEPSLEDTIKTVDKPLNILKAPSHRHENQLLNVSLFALVNLFLDEGYSKNRSFQLTGELLVKYGLLEDGDHLSDKVRHRYDRRTDGPT